MNTIKLENGNCLELMRKIEDNSIDLIFCDPPYNLSSEIFIRPDGKPDLKKAKDFMSKWLGLDAEFLEQWYSEAFRVLKHGGHCAMFGIDRQTFLFQYYAILNGFQPKQSLYWYFISNFPKASDLSKNIDKRLKTEIKGKLSPNSRNSGKSPSRAYNQSVQTKYLPNPQHQLAQKYNGLKYSVAPLKQTCEEIMVFQKPYKHGSCLNDVLAYEEGDESITVGALDIENNRCGVENTTRKQVNTSGNFSSHINGRYPAQTFIDSGTSALLDLQSGILKSGGGAGTRQPQTNSNTFNLIRKTPRTTEGGILPNSGGCSRILHKCDYEDKDFDLMVYCPKVSKSERNEGLEGFELKQVGTYAQDEWSRNNMGNTPDNKRQLVANNHPTIKPTKLLSHILKLFKTPNPQTILDPFMGSGSMGISAVECGYDYIGYELDQEYFKIAEARIQNAENKQEEKLL